MQLGLKADGRHSQTLFYLCYISMYYMYICLYGVKSPRKEWQTWTRDVNCMTSRAGRALKPLFYYWSRARGAGADKESALQSY